MALRRKIGKGPLVAALFFLVTLSPALGFINFFTMHYTFVADHYQYLACLGILIIPAEIAARSRHRATARVVAGVLIVGCITASMFYATLFRTRMALWKWNVDHNPSSFTAQHNLGVEYLGYGNQSEGVRHIMISLAQEPDDDNIHAPVARLDIADGKYDKALAHVLRATQLRPNYGLNYQMLGDIYQKLGRDREALDAYAKATSNYLVEPQNFISYAEALKRAKRLDEAAAAYRTAIILAPGNLITRYNYANLLLDLNKPLDAIDQYQFVLKYQDDAHNGPVYHNLAFAYSQVNQMPQALEAEKHATAIDAANASRK